VTARLCFVTEAQIAFTFCFQALTLSGFPEPPPLEPELELPPHPASSAAVITAATVRCPRFTCSSVRIPMSHRPVPRSSYAEAPNTNSIEALNFPCYNL
jgi:hypothetical protein